MKTSNGHHKTAFFGEGHPAEGRPCPTCGARIGKPCTATIGTAGPIRGLHADRVTPNEAAA